MAAYDGEFCYNGVNTAANARAGYNRPSTGVYYTWGGSAPPPVVHHYHKRAWRTETPGFVTWDTTDPVGAYPGGGTLDPPLGVILYQWTT